MVMQSAIRQEESDSAAAVEKTDTAIYIGGYLESLAIIERLHRLLLDVAKDEFERLRIIDINSVQALLLYNVGENVVTAGELKSRGYYQGSNVSYNLKKLVETGYMHHQKCEVDRRALRVRLTEKGRDVRQTVAELFERHSLILEEKGIVGPQDIVGTNDTLRRIERFWTDQIRFIY